MAFMHERRVDTPNDSLVQVILSSWRSQRTYMRTLGLTDRRSLVPPSRPFVGLLQVEDDVVQGLWL